MDYAFVHALVRWKGLVQFLLWLYDINCQYHKYLTDRLRETETLNQIVDIEDFRIQYGIGLFHVHGHQTSCYCRFAPTFIDGAAMVDGEVIESLWEPLNHIAGSTRAMTYFHRQETIDLHMNDSNWKKLTRVGEYCVIAYSAH